MEPIVDLEFDKGEQCHGLTRPLGSLIWWVPHMCERFHHNEGPISKRVYKGEEVSEEGGGGLEKSGCENMREERSILGNGDSSQGEEYQM